MEKARAKGNGKISSHISEQSRDERSRGKGHRDTDLGVGGHEGEEDEDEDASVRPSYLRSFFSFLTASVPAQNETQCTLTNNAAAESSFPKELASLYTQSRAHAQAPTPGPSQDGVVGHMHAASEALAAARSSMDIAEQSMKAIEQELHKLQRKLTASEQSAKAKARRIAKLEEEVVEYV
ncbi:hypothetical protein DFH11DRAFT_420856 [Phellopilus nigrolimitatus]|nr:hypothetical protein DFH11DRAFT_420856 [Phellopilus nigrolimitatus]